MKHIDQKGTLLKNISIFGTSSDAGKSTITFVIAKILQDLGYSVAPFKAQNVSNNAQVCDDGSEIAIAQYFQASILGIPTSYHLNPVLLKSGRGNSASMIVEGKVAKDIDVKGYYKDLDTLKPAVKRCFEYLDARYDCLVCEGAGSPVELNLMDKDLSNIFIAKTYNTKIILVADIEKGGVFASIYGVYHLLPEALRANVIGVIVNKFRGDLSLFDKGIEIIEKEFDIPVLGVLPYLPFNLGFEDSASLLNFTQDTRDKKLDIAVIAYPTMSNYNDFEPLIADAEISLEFVTSNIDLTRFDLVILPGSKLTLNDLSWLKERGLFAQLKETQTPLFGICGGYEMLFEKLDDDEGLGCIDDVIVFQEEKILKKGTYEIFDMSLKGFEIHHGVSKKYPLYYHDKGTFVHGIFDDDDFRKWLFKGLNPAYLGYDFQAYKKERIDGFIGEMRGRLDMKRIVKSLA